MTRGVARITNWALFALTALAGAALAVPARAGGMTEWGLGFQPAAGEIAERSHDFHHMLLIIISAICALVTALLIIVMVRFRRSRNPEPSRTTHNTAIEVIWTLVPALILVVIAIPSWRLLFYIDVVPETEMTIKATGYQWYWSYQYPDQGGFSYDSFMVPEDQLKEGQPRLLTVDNPLVIPVDTKVRVQVTGADVIHSFAMPAQAIKVDAVPGRLNETWVEFDETGTYYGQCSEICGNGHAFMPIELHVVSRSDFDAWIKQAQDKYADSMPERPTQTREIAAVVDR
jgi:cytochrome c oxidase subunit 2